MPDDAALLEPRAIDFYGDQILAVEEAESHRVFVPQPRRREAWERLVRDLPLDLLDRMLQVVPLEAVPDLSNEILKGRIRGRVVVDVNA